MRSDLAACAHDNGAGAERSPGIIFAIVNPSNDAAVAPRQATDPVPSLRVEFSEAADAALRFAFAGDSGNATRVRCARLAGPHATESWRLGENYRALVLEQREAGDDLADAARDAYAGLIARVRGSSHPYLLRIWNYLGAINDGAGDSERYRRFCVGRAAAVDASFNDPPPAATAIGHESSGILQVIALCSREPAIALENPRQTPAWSYPRDYGPVAPGFSRGAVLDAARVDARLLASGTASIVGHVSQHVGDVAEQLRESLRNLETLLAVGSERSGRRFALADCEALRVYLRRAGDLAHAQAVIATSGLPGERVLYLHGDVCRRELDVELEGVFAAQ